MKVVLLGNTQVGKTSMLNRLTSGVFKDTAPTIGAAFQTYAVSTNSKCIAMQIWDTAGQEKYHALAPMYYRSANVAVLCFDLTSYESFSALENWVDELADKGPSNLITVLVGTKSDLVENRAVTSDEAHALASSTSMAFYIECSAKTGEGISEIFTKIAQLNDTADEISYRRDPTLKDDSEQSKCC